MNNIFTQIYHENGWKGDESVSGQGSTLAQTAEIRRMLPLLFGYYGIKTLLDIPCGDFHWFSRVPFDHFGSYIGADIVPELIEENRRKHHDVTFQVLDITHDTLPHADMILCRDLLGHFSNADLQLAIQNIKRSHAQYLLATTYPNHFNAFDIETGQWRPLNLDYYCGLPPMIESINEHCTEANGKFADKSLGLWRLK